MTTRETDPEIRRLFEAERLADEAAAPDLEAVLGRAVHRPRTGARRIVLAATTMAAAAVLVAILHTSSSRRVATDSSGLPPAAVELARWTAPTDSLLQTPGSDLWTSVPDLATPVTAAETGIPFETTKGVEE